VKNLYAVIMAGGSGTRLWPRSREGQPKQFLDLIGSQTMLQQTFNRLTPLVGAGRVFVVASALHVETIRAQLPSLPRDHIIVEPTGRGTAPCIGLSALYVKRADPAAVMACLPADHYIEQEAAFREVLHAAGEVAQRGALVILGIKPTWAETGYGYIERGEPLPAASRHEVFTVKRFTEKPDAATAAEFIASGRYYWNAGIFVGRAAMFLEALREWMPATYARLSEIEAALGTPQEMATLTRIWPQVEKQTFDYGVMEHAQNVAVVPADVGWNDVGSWATLLDLLRGDGNGNVITGPHLGLDTRRTLVYSRDRLIATVGLEDMIVVDSGDVVLVCPKARAQEVRELVESLKKDGRSEYL